MFRSAGIKRGCSTNSKPKRDRGLLTAMHRVQADGMKRSCWRHDSQRSRAVPQRCEIVVWTACIRKGLGASEDYRTPPVRSRLFETS
jgi:hypothetical protein